jgi:hypothetical protein
MQQIFQVVSDLCSFASNYIFGLLKTTGRKNVESITRFSKVGSKKLYQEQLSDTNKLKDALQNIAKIGTNGKYKYLIIDGTTIQKPYGRKIENITYDRNSCSGRVERCISIVASFISTSGKSFPFDFDFWKRIKDCGDDYIKKTDIALNLIIDVCKKININMVLMDGGFTCEKILKQVCELKVEYISRFSRSRYVIIDGVSNLIQNHSCFSMKRNQRYIKVSGYYKNMKCYFVAHKRNGKNGKSEVVFYITNANLPAKKIVKIYSKRFKIESGFRTTKQKIGLADCQSRSAIKQTNHIFSVFLAYSISMLDVCPYFKNSVDCYLNFIRQKDGQKTPYQKKRKRNRIRLKRCLS